MLRESCGNNSLSAKRSLKIAVITCKSDTTSKKIYRILKRQFTVYYASQNPENGEEFGIDLSNSKSVNGFLAYYGVNAIVICSSIFDDIYSQPEIEKQIMAVIDYCSANRIKPIMLTEKYRAVLSESDRASFIKKSDLHVAACNRISEKVLKDKTGLVIECFATYGYDVKAGDMETTEFAEPCECLANEGLDENGMPLLIDEVGEVVASSLWKSGRYNCEKLANCCGENDRKFTEPTKGKEIVLRQKGCAFNLIYELMPVDYFGGEKVAKIRISLGKRLAQCIPNEIVKKTDYIVPVPKTGMYYTMGLSEQLHIPYMQGIIKDNTDARSFQLLDINVRKTFLKTNITLIEEILAGKSIILVDEAIFTGTTLKMVCRMLWDVGVKHIYIGIPTPPCYVPCSYYIQPRRNMLLEYVREDMLTEYFDVDAVYFQTVEGFLQEVPDVKGLCTECFTRR